MSSLFTCVFIELLSPDCFLGFPKLNPTSKFRCICNCSLSALLSTFLQVTLIYWHTYIYLHISCFVLVIFALCFVCHPSRWKAGPCKYKVSPFLLHCHYLHLSFRYHHVPSPVIIRTSLLAVINHDKQFHWVFGIVESLFARVAH